jgi:hypothetical protein
MRQGLRALTRAPRIVLLIAGLAAGFGLGAGALATVAQTDDSAQLHACVANNTGVVRLVNADVHCYSNEHAVAWSATGPAGATGATGAQGERGPSDVYVQEQVGVITHLNISNDETIVSFTAPSAGSYVLQSRVQVEQPNAVAPSTPIRCELKVNGVTIGSPITVSIPASLAASDNFATVRNDAASTLNAGDQALLRCFVPGFTTFSRGYLQAQLVGNLHVGGNP